MAFVKSEFDKFSDKVEPENKATNRDSKTGDYEQPGYIIDFGSHPENNSKPDGIEGRSQQKPKKPWYRSKWFQKATGPLGMYTLGLLVVAGLQWWVTRGQLEEMRSDSKQTDKLLKLNEKLLNQNKEQIKALSDAAEAARISAEAARSQTRAAIITANAAKAQVEAATAANEINRQASQATLSQSERALKASIDMSQLEMRPYITVNGSDGLHLFGPPNQPPIAFRADLINVGRSLAKNVRLFYAAKKVRAYIAGMPDVQTIEGVFNAGLAESHHAPEDIAPNGTIETLVDQMSTVGSLSGAELAEFNSGRLVFIFTGGAIYGDIVTLPHRTEFCYYVNSTSIRTGTFIGCGRHNTIQ